MDKSDIRLAMEGLPAWMENMTGTERNLKMLISQNAEGKASGRQGCHTVSFAELRKRLAGPSGINDVYRQRLLDLAKVVTRVQALGDEYARIELSEHATTAVGEPANAV